MKGMRSRSSSRSKDHQVGETRAARRVAERGLSHIVGGLDHQFLGRHKLFQHSRNVLSGKAIGPFQHLDEFDRNLTAHIARTSGRE